MKQILLLLLLIIQTFQTRSQITFQETIPYYSTAGDTKEIIITNDGGYALLRVDWGNTGIRNCIKLVKTNAYGNISWVAGFFLNNTLNSYEGLAGFSVKQTTDGGYIITGNSYLAGNAEVLLIKTDNGGNLLWNKFYGSQSSSLGDYGYDVIQTTDGGYLITGQKGSGTIQKLWLIKTNSLGVVTWQRIIYPSGGQSTGYTIRQTIDGGYFITGATGTNQNQYLIKTDVNGNTIWGKSYAISDGMHYGEPTKDGGYIITSSSSTVGALLKIKSDGSLDWVKKYNGTASFTTWHTVKQTKDNGYILCGHSNGFGNIDAATLLKTDSLGNVSFFKTIDNYQSIFTTIKQTSDNGFIIGGNKYGSPSVILIAKTDSLGDSGCNMASFTPTVTQPSVTAKTETVTNTAGVSYNTGTLSINAIVYTNSTITTFCTTQNLFEINKFNELRVFPNPTYGEFTIQTGENSKSAKIKIINLTGEIVFENNIILTENYKINISNLNDGTYILEINSNNIISRNKLLKISHL